MKWKTSYITVAIIVVGYVISAFRFCAIQQDIRRTAQDTDDSRRVIRVTHWQLEPGFREALQWAIDRYNDLPHVREANVFVLQLPITERVYNQFMNVHLISGTAPDIATKGMTRLIQGNNAAKFYTPLAEYIGDPNPYNAPEYLSDDLPEETREFLSTASWRDTFIDGMLGGFDWTLNDYYAIPISNFGSLRLFYNKSMLLEVKAFAKEFVERDDRPEWLDALWIRVGAEGEQVGFLPDNARLRDWLENDQVPETLGQFIFYCEAVQAFASAHDRPLLVPISGSNYDPGNLAFMYEVIFLSNFWEDIESQPGQSFQMMDALAAWEAGVWSFQTPAYRAYLEFSQLVSSYFPRGFLGLDREQAQRRFIMGNAAIISSGAWDASSIFLGASNRDREEDRFDVLVSRSPMPSEDERWYEFLPMDRSEAAFTTGVPLAVNQQTPHFRWVLDFLRFMSSQPINQEFSRQANWLPAIVGAEPSEFMRPFMPDPEGIPGNLAINLRSGWGNLRTVYTGQLKLLMTGDITIEEFEFSVVEFMENPRLGMQGYWVRELQRSVDHSRARDRTVSAEEFRWLALGEEASEVRLNSLYYGVLRGDKGLDAYLRWQRFHGDEPYPDSFL